jgi:hypothetical protein
VFRNNRNKQKTNRNNSKFVKIETFLIPHTISSVCFGCFDTGPKQRNKPKKILFGFTKKNEKQPKQVEFRFVSVRTQKKINCFEDTLIEICFLEIFLVCFGLFRLFRYRSETPKQTEKNWFGFAKQTKKQPKQNEFRFVSVRTEKKFDCFEDTLVGDEAGYMLTQCLIHTWQIVRPELVSSFVY